MKEEKLKKELEINFEAIRVIIQREGRLVITTNKVLVLELLGFLKERGLYRLTAISCVDWIENKEFELIYHICFFQDGLHIMLKTRISRDNPGFMSVIPIFKNAQTYEREIWEMFGIRFEGNSRLVPLFLDRWKQMPPFRKDFDTRKYVEENFDKIPPVEEK